MQNQSPLRTLSVIHLALIAGQIMFAAVSIAIKGKTEIILQANDDIFFFIIPGIALSGILVSSMIFKKLVEQAKTKQAPAEKLKQYLSASIIRWALIEGPSLFAITVYFLKGNLFYILISALLILFMFTLRPTREKVATELDVRPDELP